MITKKLALVCLATALSISCSPTEEADSSEDVTADGSMLAKASSSFSDIPFDSAKVPDGATLLTERSGTDCATDPQSDCTFVDANGVEHHYLEGLKIKSIAGDNLANGSISAFDIGDARTEEAIKERVAAFSGNSDFRCEDVREEFETGIDSVCYLDLDEGWAMLQFFEGRVILVELSSGNYI